MTIQRQLAGKIPEEVRRTLVDMDRRLTQIEQMWTKSMAGNGNGGGLSAAQKADVAGLIGALAQGVIGENATDPQLPGQIGGGTVTSITVAAGNQLTGGGTITTTGTITLAVTANPSFTTVNVTTSYSVAGTKVIGAQGAAVTDYTDNIAGAVANTLAAIPDPANSPVDADALRDDIVANVLPKIRDALSSIASKENVVRARLRASTGHGLIGG